MIKLTNKIRKERLPPSLHKTFDKSLKSSRSAAIKIFCVECMGADSGYAKMVRECSSKTCALYPFRPYQSKNDEEEVDGTEEESASYGNIESQIQWLRQQIKKIPKEDKKARRPLKKQLKELKQKVVECPE